MTPVSAPSNTAGLVEKWLACPRTHQPLVVTHDRITCPQSGFSGEIRDGVAVMGPIAQSFFDTRFEVMQRGHQKEGGEWRFCYGPQIELLEGHLRAGHVVLDVGCGPWIPYKRPGGVFVIGLEPSFASIRANKDVDLRVFGSADAIPMAQGVADVVVCFYSIHHMVGATVSETLQNVARAFREFGRVLKPGGELFVFEMTPIRPFVVAQSVAWNAVRRLAPKTLDMFFVSKARMSRIASEVLPGKAPLEPISFRVSPFTTFPPVFSLPWLKVPRFLYPLDAKLYRWRKPSH